MSTTTIPAVNAESSNVNNEAFISKKLKDLSFQDEKEFKDHESQQSPLKEQQSSEHQEDQEEEHDSDYEVNEEEERDQEEQDEEDELMMDKICVQENENEIKSEEAINDENVQRELNEALDIVKNIALNEKEKIINKICDEYELENNGESLDYNTLKSAFTVLKTQMVDQQEDASIAINTTGIEPKDVNIEKEQEPEDQEQDQDEDQEEEDDEDQDQDQEEDQGQDFEDEDDQVAGLSSEDDEEVLEAEDEDDAQVAYTTEEIRQQVEEAMQVASELGKKAREELAQAYYETIIEATGAEPTEEQIQDVFKRMEEQLKEEAEDELFDNVDEIVQDNDESEQEATLATLNELKTMSDDDIRRQALLNLAKETLSVETQLEAKEKFTNIAQREPTQREYEDTLIGFSITTFNESTFNNEHGHEKNISDANAPSGNWEQDEDYDPDQDSQVSEEEETLDEKIEKLDDLKQQVDNKILQKSVKAFERVFQRCPNVDEQLYNIQFLLSTDKINVPLDGDNNEFGGNQSNVASSGAQTDVTQSDSGAPASVSQQL